MDFYSGKQPNLIGPVMKHTICKVIKKPQINNTVSDKISNFMSNLYKTYIMQNKLLIFIVILIIGFLFYRYYNTKSSKKENPEKFANQDYNLMKDIRDYQTRNLIFDTPQTMNPIEPVEKQKEEVYYPPSPLPINIPGDGIVYTRNLYANPKPYTPINSVDYNYNNVYTNPSRSYYAGSYDTYKNPEDTNIVNPLGWPNDFNGATGKFINEMTRDNHRVLTDYQTILDTSRGNLIDGLKIGSNYMDVSQGEYIMQPPFADD